MNKLTSMAAALTLGASLLSAPAQAETKFVTIGTGGVTGCITPPVARSAAS